MEIAYERKTISTGVTISMSTAYHLRIFYVYIHVYSLSSTNQSSCQRCLNVLIKEIKKLIATLILNLFLNYKKDWKNIN